jgi:tripartite-type tricarboxylate transporter receptor subunit TctC
MPGFRKLSLIALLAACAIGWHGAGAAEEFPTRLVKVIVPFPPGSTLDVLVRIVTEEMAKTWHQPVIIENISGAAGNIGTDRFARSEPDGYTLLIAPPGPFGLNPLLYKEAPDPSKFVPITVVATVPNVLVIRNNLGVNSIADLIALAKANPGKLTFASQGIGSTAYLTAKLFETRAGISMVHVPYRGAGPALNDIIAGHVDMMFDTIVTSLRLHQAGTAKILAIANSERSRALPDVPTIAESGLQVFRSASWFGCAAPPGTPPAIADRISKDMVAILHRPDVSARLRALMLEPVGTTPAEAGRFFVEETAQWAQVIKDANVTPQ